MTAHTYKLYGRTVSAPAPLPAPAAASVSPDITFSPAIVPHVTRASAAEPYAYAAQPDGSVCINWLDRVHIMVSADGSVVSFDVEAADSPLVFDFLLAQILSVVLLQQNVESTHATAVAYQGCGFALVGDCGFGKSTLAAALIAKGARLLTDDLLVLDDQLRILPGAQRIKLTPEAARATIGERSGVSFGKDSNKLSIGLDANEFQTEPVRLERLYLLETGAEPAMHPSVGSDAFRQLVAATFNPLNASTDRLKHHMSFTSNIAKHVGIFRLVVPWDLSRLTESVALVQAHAKG